MDKRLDQGDVAVKTEMAESNMLHGARYARSFWAEKIGNKIYMYAWEYNAICIYDEDTNEISVQKGNSNYDGYMQCLYESSVVYKECIYFIPGVKNSSDILKYNLKSQEIGYIRINTRNTAYSSVIIQGILYLLPIHYSDYLILIRLDCDEISYIKIDYGKQLGSLCGIERPLFYGVLVKDHAIWRACMVGPFIQKYYYEEERFEYIKVNGIEEEFISLAYDGQYFWLLMLKGKRFIKWDAEENRVIQKFGFEEKQQEDDYVYTHLFFYKGSIWIIPVKEHVIEKVDVVSGERILINCGEADGFHADCEDTQSFAEGYAACDNFIYLIPFQSNGIVKINVENNELSFMNTSLDTKKLTEKIVTQDSYNESMCSIEDFINFSLGKNKDKAIKNENCGHKIWGHISDER